jgi:hypothetical protein
MSKIKLGPQTERFRRLCRLNALAWLACLKFTEAALGEKRFDEMDKEFIRPRRGFFPVKVLKAAKQELCKAYHAAEKEEGKGK